MPRAERAPVYLLLLLGLLQLALSDIYPTTKVVSIIQPTFVGPKYGITLGQSEGVDGPKGNQTNFVAGAINRILAHPKDPNILYVGTVNGGVWKTVEAQKKPSWNITWTPLTDKYGLLAIGALQFEYVDRSRYSDPSFNTVIAAVGGCSSYHRASGLVTGVFVTKDGGETWDATDSDLFDDVNLKGAHMYGKTIVVCGESKPSKTLGSGTFLSLDSGVTYKHIDMSACRDMVSDQSDPEVVYKAHPASGILESLDSGKTWRVITDKTSLQGWSGGKFRGKKLKNMRMSLWSDGDRKILYAGLLSEDLIGLIRGDYNKTGGVWTWRSLPLPFTIEKDGVVGLNPKEDEGEEEGGGQGDVHFSITVDNRDPEVVYVGGDRQPALPSSPYWPNSIGAMDYSGRLFRYRTGDPAAIPITHNYTKGSAPHADSRHLTMDALGNLLESDDGGIYMLSNTPDGQQRWESMNGNIAALEAHSVRYVDGIFITGNQDTGTTFGGPDGHWTSFQKGDGGVVRVAKSNSFTRIYISYYRLGSFGYIDWEDSSSYKRVYTDNIVNEPGYKPYSFGTWCQVNFYQTFSAHATDPKRLAIPCPESLSIIETKDGGDSWSFQAPKNPTGFGGFSDVVYGGKLGGKLYSNVMVGLSSREIYIRGPSDATMSPSRWSYNGFYGYAIAIASDPEAYTRLWILLDSRQVIYTDDFGQSFSEWGLSIPADVSDLSDAKLLYVTGGHLLLSGRFGLLWLAPGQRSWSVIRGGVPNGYITDVGYEPKEDLLYFSAFGRGIFSLRGATSTLNGLTPPVAAPVAAPRAKPPVYIWENSPSGGARTPSGDAIVDPPSTWSTNQPWLWIVIGVGAAIVLAVVITVSVVCCRRKSQTASPYGVYNSNPSMSSMHSYGAYAPLSDDESVRV